jgi:hypothetical protein
MKGESRGDFSRDTFDSSKNFLRVLMQQGRVSLDADWNEQVDILLHYIQTLAKDIIGPFAGPVGEELGFGITPINASIKSFNIGTGRYYVDGILCENEKKDSSCEVSDVAEDPFPGYYYQPDYPTTSEITLPRLENMSFPLLVYLDVWERHISYVEDDDIREKALGGPDTASRSKVVWQVKVLEEFSNVTLQDGETRCKAMWRLWPDIKEKLQPLHRGCLKAQAKKPEEGDINPCITSPEARYRGEENQLYRVEIHRGGTAGAATFKWSRDNGSVIFPICDISGNEIMLEHLGRDERLSLKVGDWVEVIDDAYTLLVQSRPSPLPESEFWPRPLAQVEKVDLAEMKVTLKLKKDYALRDYNDIRDFHPLLRRWDYREPDPTKRGEPEFKDNGFSALVVKEGSCKEDDSWLTLEDGVQICFQSPVQGKPANDYRAGDYWLIPVRTATGDVEWPNTITMDGQKEVKTPRALPPHGVNHHYAPLAVLRGWSDKDRDDFRCVIETTSNSPSESVATKKSRPAKGREG